MSSENPTEEKDQNVFGEDKWGDVPNGSVTVLRGLARRE